MLLVVFGLGERRFAVHLEAVDRVIRSVEMAPLPGAPPVVAGVINLFGRISPVLDLRRAMGLPEKALDLTDKLIIARVHDQPLALWVDSVEGVIDYPGDKVVKTPEILGSAEDVEGMVKLKQEIVFIENLEKLHARVFGHGEATNG